MFVTCFIYFGTCIFFFFSFFVMKISDQNEGDNKKSLYIHHISVSFPLTQQLQSIPLNNFIDSNPPISELLEHPSIFVEMNGGNTKFISYIIQNMRDFINLIFSSDQHSIIAYNLVKIKQSLIIDAIGQSPVFYKSAIKIISSDPIDSVFLNRLMFITFLVIKQNEVSFPPNCGFILQLFQVIDNYGVVTFFDNILQPQLQLFHVQNWLNSVNFFKIVTEELNKTEPKGDPYFDADTMKYISLLSIVRVCANSQALSNSFHSAQVIEAVTRPLPDNCFHSAINEQWLTICHLYNSSTADIMRGFFHQAVLMIENNDRRTLKGKEAAIFFLKKMIESDDLMIQFYINAELEETLLRILFEYTSNTFLVNAVLNFVKTGMKNFSLAPKLVSTFLPPLLYEATESSSNYLREISNELIDWCAKFESTNDWFSIIVKPLKQYKNFVSTSLIKWRELIKPYQIKE